jgi:hypothetical protein
MTASESILRTKRAKVAADVQSDAEALEIASEILAERYPDGFDILDHEQIASLRAEVAVRLAALMLEQAA